MKKLEWYKVPDVDCHYTFLASKNTFKRIKKI